ncbi:MAG: hypothetical protein PVI90_09030 [Desulfobacteraceae bacterium]|jgi:hypothetical protein
MDKINRHRLTQTILARTQAQNIPNLYPGFLSKDLRPGLVLPPNSIYKCSKAVWFMRILFKIIITEDIDQTMNQRLLLNIIYPAISLGQVFPQEIVGMVYHHQSNLVKAGGKTIIKLSHFLTAIFGMEQLMWQDLSYVYEHGKATNQSVGN